MNGSDVGLVTHVVLRRLQNKQWRWNSLCPAVDTRLWDVNKHQNNIKSNVLAPAPVVTLSGAF